MAIGTLKRFKINDAEHRNGERKRGRMPMARARYIRALGEALAELHSAGTLPTECMVPGRTWAQVSAGQDERGSPTAQGK